MSDPSRTPLSCAEIGARGEEIKTNSSEYLWICKGIRPPLLPNKIAVDPNLAAHLDPNLAAHLQVRLRPAALATRGK
jgi:hypothetical protein